MTASLPPLARRDVALVVVIVAVGAWLRFSGLSQGIPFSLGVDEPEIVERAVRMMKTGDFHPDFFDYPGLYIYLQTAVATLRFMAGAMAGLWATLDQAPSAEFYLWGRAVTAAFGTATILVVFAIARRLGVFAATVAALLIAVQPMHVRESHYVLTDVPMTFFAALATLLTLRAHERGTWRAYVWPGIAAGLAAGTKYHGGSVLVLPLLAVAMSRAGTPRITSALAAIAGAAAAFMAAAPYTWLDLPAFLDKFGTLAHMYAVGPPAVDPAWLVYLKHLALNWGWAGVTVAGAAVLLALERTWRAPAEERATWALNAAFVVVTCWLIAGQRLVWARYLLPILPGLAVLVGGLICRVVSLVAERTERGLAPALATAALVALTALQPARQAVGWVRAQALTGTAELTYRWIDANVPEGARVAVESRGLLLPPARFRSENFARLIEWDLAEFRGNGYTYLVASSQAFGEALAAAVPTAQTHAYRALFDRLQLLTTIRPTGDHPGEEWRVYRIPEG